MSTSDDKIHMSAGGVLSLPERYLERALHHLGRKKYDDAILDLTEALKHEKRNPELLATRGYVYLKADDVANAEKDFEKALKIDPTQWIIYYGRAVHAYEAEQYDKALEQLNLMQRFVPLRPELYILRAAIFYQKGDKKRAMIEIDNAEQTMQPDDEKRKKEAQKWLRAIKKL